MKSLKSILTGALISLSAFLPTYSEARDPQTFIVPTNSINFQTLLNNAEDGDVYDIQRLDKDFSDLFFVGDLTIPHSVTIKCSNNAVGIYGRITTTGTSKIRIEDTYLIGGAGNLEGLLHLTESSSATLDNCSVGRAARNSIIKESTGNLTITNSSLTEWYTDGNIIKIKNGNGTININNSNFYNPHGAINFECGNYLTDIGEVYIVNNTFSGNTVSQINFDTETNLDGEIANNSFYDNSSDELTGEEKLNKIKFRKNNIYKGKPPALLSTLGILSLKEDIIDSGFKEFDDNYSFDPSYTYSGELSSSSPLWYRGLYIDGITTWFPDETRTWIGKADISFAPWSIPEPKTFLPFMVGCSYLFTRRKKPELKKDTWIQNEGWSGDF